MQSSRYALFGGAKKTLQNQFSGGLDRNLGLHQRHGLPTRFRQKLVHEGRNLDDDEKLDTAMDLTVRNLKPS